MEHGDFPTLKEIVNVWNFGPEPGEGAQQEEVQAFTRKKQVAIWCWTKCLPAASGKGGLFSGQNNHCYFLPVHMMKVKQQLVFRVTSADEAFGWLLCENCINKWENQAKGMTRENNFKKPQFKKKDPSTHIYKAKWTDSSAGRGAGWDLAAGKPFQDYKDTIKDFRTKDHANKWATFEKVLGWVREANNVTSEFPPKSGGSSGNKVRKPNMKEELDPEVALVPHSDDANDPSIFLDFGADEDCGSTHVTRSTSTSKNGAAGSEFGILD